MADISYIDQQLASFPSEQRKSLKLAFQYLLDNWRLGVPTSGERATNSQLYYFTATTPAVANTEFAIVHGIGQAPYNIVQVLDPNAVNAQMIPLKVTRLADADRLYLSSSVASANFTIAVEA